VSKFKYQESDTFMSDKNMQKNYIYRPINKNTNRKIREGIGLKFIVTIPILC